MSNYDALQAMRAEESELPDEEKQFLTNLMKDLVAYYVVHEKSKNSKSLPRDKVTNFHVSNGAELANIHWLSHENCQPSDSIGGAGMMVNYRYYPETIDIRKQNFMDRHVVRQSPKLAERYATRMNALHRGDQAQNAEPANCFSIPSPHVASVTLAPRVDIPKFIARS